MKDEKMKNEREKKPENGLKDEITSKNESLGVTNPEKNSQYDEDDLLYKHKPENRGSSIQWNSIFYRRPGH